MTTPTEQQALGEQSGSPSISSVLFPCNGVLVTSTNKNSTVHLWSLPAQTSQAPVCLQSILFTHKTKEFLGHLSFDPTGTFLFLASTSLCVGFILHLDAAGGRLGASKDKDNRTYVPKFDYLTEFEVTQPILSFTIGLQSVASQPTEDGEEPTEKRESILQLFCVQTKAIQIHQTPTDQCYSKQQVAEDDTPGPLTQIGKVGESLPAGEPEAPSLSSSAEARRVFEEYNQQQQNLWLSHSVEVPRRNSYAPEEQYHDPALSPLATPTFPASATQPTVLLDKPSEAPEHTQDHYQTQVHSEQPQDQPQILPEQLHEQPQEQPQERPQEQLHQQPHEQPQELLEHAKDLTKEFTEQVQEHTQEYHDQSQQVQVPPTPEHPEASQEERAQEEPQKEEQSHGSATEIEHVQDKQLDNIGEAPEKSTEQPQAPTVQPAKPEEPQTVESPEHEIKQEAVPNQDSSLPSQVQQNHPTKAKPRGGRNKKENSTHNVNADGQPATAPVPVQQQKQKATAPVTILNRNTAQKEENAAPRAVSPITSTSAPLGQDDLRKFELNMMTNIYKISNTVN